MKVTCVGCNKTAEIPDEIIDALMLSEHFSPGDRLAFTCPECSEKKINVIEDLITESLTKRIRNAELN